MENIRAMSPIVGLKIQNVKREINGWVLNCRDHYTCDTGTCRKLYTCTCNGQFTDRFL